MDLYAIALIVTPIDSLTKGKQMNAGSRVGTEGFISQPAAI